MVLQNRCSRYVSRQRSPCNTVICVIWVYFNDRVIVFIVREGKEKGGTGSNLSGRACTEGSFDLPN